MSVSDFIADQLTVIRNAIRVGKKDVVIKRSNLLESIAGILKREGFIENYQVIEDKKQGRIKLYLKYTEEGLPVMEQLKRISKPGRREHCRAEEVRSVKGGVGIALFSTNNGILTDKEAREQGVGGEILCQIW